MGIALFTFDRLLVPIRSLAAWLMGPPRRVCVEPASQAAPATRKPLRVVRVVEASCGPASAGRMVISGRMADVCAELERLAALEPVAH